MGGQSCLSLQCLPLLQCIQVPSLKTSIKKIMLIVELWSPHFVSSHCAWSLWYFSSSWLSLFCFINALVASHLHLWTLSLEINAPKMKLVIVCSLHIIKRGVETWGFHESPSYPKNIWYIDALFLREKEKNLPLISLYIGAVVVIRKFLQSQTFSYNHPFLIHSFWVM